MAKIADLMHILDKLSKHYSSEAKTGGFREDWADEEDRRKIGKIFKEMADFYLIFDTIEKREKDQQLMEEVDLWFIYDSLAEIFWDPLEEMDDEDDDGYVETDILIDELVEILMSWEWKKGEMVNAHEELQTVFVDLDEYYQEIYMTRENPGEEDKLPVKIGQLKKAFSHLAYRDGSMGSPYERMNDNDDATTIDLLHLFDKLVIHYSRVAEELQSDIDAEEALTLAEIFEEMSYHHMVQEQLDDGDDADLFIIYDNLQLIFEEYSNLVAAAQKGEKLEYQQIVDDLVQVVEELEIKPDIKRKDLTKVFDLLNEQYNVGSYASDDNNYFYQILPVMSSDLRNVLDALPGQAEASGHPFDKKDGEEWNARIVDMTEIYDLLSVYYSQPSKKEYNDIGFKGTNSLANIFSKMAQMYNDLDSQAWKETTADLYYVYDSLSGIYEMFADEAMDREANEQDERDEQGDNVQAKDDLEDLLAILEGWTEGDEDLSATDLQSIFEDLTKFYTDEAFELKEAQPTEIPQMKVKKIKRVYEHLSEIDSAKDNVFELRADRDTANVRDLNYLLEKLEYYYSGVSHGALENSFSIDDKKSLAEIFRWISEFYLTNDEVSEQMKLDNQTDLIFIYSRLYDVYLQQSMAAVIEEVKEEEGKKVDAVVSELQDYKDSQKAKLNDKIDRLEGDVSGLTGAVEKNIERQEQLDNLPYKREETFTSAKKEEHERNFQGAIMKMATTLAMFGIAMFVLLAITAFCICRIIRKRRGRWNRRDSRFSPMDTHDTTIEL